VSGAEWTGRVAVSQALAGERAMCGHPPARLSSVSAATTILTWCAEDPATASCGMAARASSIRPESPDQWANAT